MKLRSVVYGAILLVGAALIPARASAQSCIYNFTLGLGGFISGCYSATISELGEDAGLVSNQYYWAGNFGSTSGTANAPTVGGTLMFDDDCGSSGFPNTFAFCTGNYAKTPASFNSLSGELVLGLDVPFDPTWPSYWANGGFWVYSGDMNRNATPAPPGFQAVLLQLTNGGVDDPGQYLFGWEDLNTGCTARPAVNRFREEDLGDPTILNNFLSDCSAITAGGNSDSDFNDSYLRLSISGTGVGTNTITPEPMTMSLMAFGLVAMAGVSFRNRKRRKNV
jgi:hypothetical protein